MHLYRHIVTILIWSPEEQVSSVNIFMTETHFSDYNFSNSVVPEPSTGCCWPAFCV